MAIGSALALVLVVAEITSTQIKSGRRFFLHHKRLTISEINLDIKIYMAISLRIIPIITTGGEVDALLGSSMSLKPTPRAHPWFPSVVSGRGSMRHRPERNGTDADLVGRRPTMLFIYTYIYIHLYKYECQCVCLARRRRRRRGA